MEQTRFDGISKLFARKRLSRRQAMRQGTAGLAAAGLAATGLNAAVAQDGTPAASPVADNAEQTMYLFVQSFQAGTLAPHPDGESHTLTLERGLGQTIYFGDRPSRDVGVSPTGQFLATLGFSEENPPNAALLVDAGAGETDLAVVELFEPSYDEATHTATYRVKGLEAWEATGGLGLQDSPTDLSGLAPVFGAAHLFIDDCADGTVGCFATYRDGSWGGAVGSFQGQGMCYNYLVCIPCEPHGHTQPDRCSTLPYWSKKCQDTYSSQCGELGGGCRAFYDNADLLGCTDGSTPSGW
jgi:hypothetical protein